MQSIIRTDLNKEAFNYNKDTFYTIFRNTIHAFKWDGLERNLVKCGELESTFQMKGQVYHQIDPLLAVLKENLSFLQVYYKTEIILV